jgi:LmbE family N-acetylglucosaminyl deacetylase
MASLPEVSRALVVVAHPDDVDFGAAGTVALLVEGGATVAYCIVTDGAAGALEPGVDPRELAAQREEEQRAAAKAVGVEDVVFLGYPDGRLYPTLEVRRDISRVIRRLRPELVITQSPERNWRRLRACHPDHLAAGEAAVAAVYPDARNPYAHPELAEEGLAPHAVPRLWLMAAPDPDRAVEVTSVFERKLAALACHKSQLRMDAALEERLRRMGTEAAAEQGLPPGSLAEAFREVRVD